MKLFRTSSSLTTISGFLLAFSLSLFLFSAIVAAAPKPVSDPTDEVDNAPDPTGEPELEGFPKPTDIPDGGSGDQLQTTDFGPAVLVSNEELTSDDGDDGEGNSKLRARRPPFCLSGWNYSGAVEAVCCYYTCCWLNSYLLTKGLYWAQAWPSDTGLLRLWTTQTCGGNRWWVGSDRAYYFGDKPTVYSMSQ